MHLNQVILLKMSTVKDKHGFLQSAEVMKRTPEQIAFGIQILILDYQYKSRPAFCQIYQDSVRT